MSEYAQIWRDWEHNLAHARYGGREPRICVMGQHTYDAFLGALAVRVNGLGCKGTERSRTGPLTVDGIDIYPSCEDSAGYKFGYIDEEIIL